MSEKLTRREFSGRAAAVVTGLAAGAVPSWAQQHDEVATSSPIDRLEERLGSRLPEDVRSKAVEALKGIASTSKAREKHRLPEGSEPCTIYVPTPQQVGRT